MTHNWALVAVLAAGVAAAPLGLAQDASVEEPTSSVEEPTVSEVVGDFDTGERIYKTVCANCHGPTAKGMASFPKLVGNSAEHITMRLEAYRAGEKIGPNTPLMAPLATGLTDEEIASLALYITTGFE